MTDGALTPDLMLGAYSAGIFPMAERRDDPSIFWVDPQSRGVIPLRGFHLSRSLRRTMLRGGLRISFDADFLGVIDGCAAREETWINDTIRGLCAELHIRGYAHSAEVWDGRRLVGGVYGLAIGGAFFGESMFSRQRDASKVAMAYLVDRLAQAGFTLFDTQFVTPHLSSLGAIEISRAEYRRRLAEAIEIAADFAAAGPVPPPQDVVQRITQTS